jgi:hypothetical protein
VEGFMSGSADALERRRDQDPQPFPSINIDHVADPATTRTRKRAGTLSQVASSFIPTSAFDADEKSPIRSHPAPTQRKPSKARNGHLKLILHVLEALESRPRPPHIRNGAAAYIKASDSDKTLGKLAQSVKDAVTSRQATSRSNTSRDADSDEEDSPGECFFTDETLTRLEELKEVLLVAKSQGWHIFDDGSVQLHLDRFEYGSVYILA